MDTSRLRRLAILVAASGILLAASRPIARHAVVARVRAICEARTRGDCRLDDVRFGLATVSIARMVSVGRDLRADVHGVVLAGPWWQYLVGRFPATMVHVDRAELSTTAPTESPATAVVTASERGGAVHGSVRVSELVVDRLEIRAARVPGLVIGATNVRLSPSGDDVWAVSATAVRIDGLANDAAIRANECRATALRSERQLDASCLRAAATASIEHLDLLREQLRSAVRSYATLLRQSGDPRDLRSAGGWHHALHIVGLDASLRRGEATLLQATGVDVRASWRPDGRGSVSASLDDAARRMRIRAESGAETGAWAAEIEGSGPLAELTPWLPWAANHIRGEGHATVSAHLAGTRGPSFEATGSVALDGVALDYPGVATGTIEDVRLFVSGTVRVDIPLRRIETGRVRAELNEVGVELEGRGELAPDGAVVLALRARVPTVNCGSLAERLPAAVVGPLRDLDVEGSVALDASLALDTRNPDRTEATVQIDNNCRITNDRMANNVTRFAGVFVQRAQEPAGVRAFVTGPGSPAWTALARVSPSLVGAVLFREDGGFYRHHGIDVEQLRVALVRNLRERRFAYGASTITMQLARNLFLSRDKTLVRKLQEIVLSWYLEQTLDKDHILELYLNVAEFGPGVYGVGPASRYFFGREPAELTALQSMFVASLLPAPIARAAVFRRGRVAANVLEHLRAQVRRAARAHLITEENARLAELETLEFRSQQSAMIGAGTLLVDAALEDSAAVVVVGSMTPPIAESMTDDSDRAVESAWLEAP